MKVGEALMSPSIKRNPGCPASNSSEYIPIFLTAGTFSGAISSKSMFSSTFGRLIPAEININVRNTASVNFVQLSGKFTALTKAAGGGCEGFFRSNIMVRFGTITIVMM